MKVFPDLQGPICGDGHDFNMPTNCDAVIQYFIWGSLQMQLFFPTFLCKQKRKKEKKKKKENLDWKLERVVYVKGKQKNEFKGAC